MLSPQNLKVSHQIIYLFPDYGKLSLFLSFLQNMQSQQLGGRVSADKILHSFLNVKELAGRISYFCANVKQFRF